jgi:hypothetical protein
MEKRKMKRKKLKIALLNTQNVMETRLAKLYYFEADEFENDRNFQLISSFRVTVMA